MQGALFGLLVAFIIGTVRSQTWTGTYTADSSCSTSVCCCLSGKVVVTMSSTNIYAVNSAVNGACSSVSTFAGTAYTNGYSGWMVVAGANDTVTLSSDSNTITVTNSVTPACSGKGLKNGVNKPHASFIMLVAIPLIGMMISV